MKRALGKGLSQLVTDQYEGTSIELPIQSIQANPDQPRRVFEDEAIAELAESIRERGLLSPVLVRPLKDNIYELIAGERRLRAATEAGLTRIPAIVRSADAMESLELALIENLQRQDLSPVECARAYRRLIDDFHLTQESVAERVGKSRAAIANTLRLLNLPPRILSELEKGTITEGHARALLTISDPVRQLGLLGRILHEKLSVRETELAAQAAKAEKPAPVKPKEVPVKPEWVSLQEVTSERLGASVKFVKHSRGGQIVIPFYSDDDLGRILESMGVDL